MLLETYDSKGLLTVIQVNGETSDAGVYAYRGDLVLKEGELREGSQKDRKPPKTFVVQAAIIIIEDKIKFINGLLPTLDLLPLFIAKYKEDIAADCTAILYVENIAKGIQVELEGIVYKLIPYKEGMVWNEFLEEMYIEKSEIKKLSPADKVAAVYVEAKKYAAKTELVSFETAQASTIEVIKDASVGAI